MTRDFADHIGALLPADEARALLHALECTAPTVSVRVNAARGAAVPTAAARVPWCGSGFYCEGERPQFTFDPLWHAGLYYVQEASSMFISHVIASLVHRPVRWLDLCAAPGGKTTAALQALPGGSLVVANEVVPTRALALADNVTRWGAPAVAVTRDEAAAYGRLGAAFDVIAADVPCSGEGMMRKEPQAIAQWSTQLVRQCAATQRKIVDDVWPALKPGGLLVYSTCTFNREENEQMLDHIADDLGAESVDVPLEPSWHIMPGIGTCHSCYRFMPHRTRGEGLFMAVMRKSGGDVGAPARRAARQAVPRVDKSVARELASWLDTPDDYRITPIGDTLCALPAAHADFLTDLTAALRTLQAGVPLLDTTARKPQPHPALAYSRAARRGAWPVADVDYTAAVAYLRGEALTLPSSTPRGIVQVAYSGVPLGFANNLGSRANNLYPKPWRITATHVPAAPPRVLRSSPASLKYIFSREFS